MSPYLSLLLIPIFAFADRWIGWGGDAEHRKTKGVLVAILGSALVAYALHQWVLIYLAVVWVIVRRMLPFDPPFGTTTVRKVGDGVQTLARWSLPALLSVIWSVDVHWPVLGLVVPLMAFAVGATVLAVIYGAMTKPGRAPLSYDPNVWIEAGRGALYGAALAAWVLL